MKIFAICAMALLLIAATGCSKQTDTPADTMSTEAGTANTAPASKEMAPESAPSESVTEKIADESREAVSTLKVKTEDIMADLEQSIDALKQKAASFDQSQLQAYVDTYKEMILDKKDQIAEVGAKIKELPLTEMMGEKARALKEQMSQYSDELEALKERADVYLNLLKTGGAAPSTP